MPVPQLSRNNYPSPPRVQIETTNTAEALARTRGLTDRDLKLITYLNRHRVLTAVQISRLLFDSDSYARSRLTALHKQGVLARFRREVWPGSQAWRYTLGHVGAAVHAAATDSALPRPTKVTEKVMRLAHSPHTEHLLGVNEFFTTLAGYARTHQNCALDQWWPESVTADACGGIVHPDGYGEWTQHGLTLAFFLEYDNGTETLEKITGKISKYAELAQAGIRKPVLFAFTTAAREHHTHQVLTPRYSGGTPVSIATTSLDSTRTSQHNNEEPAILSPAWLLTGHTERRHLIDLAHPRTRSDAAATGRHVA